MVVTGAAVEGVSPKIDVKRMVWLCSGQEHAALDWHGQGHHGHLALCLLLCAGHTKPAFMTAITFKIKVNYLVLITSLLSSGGSSGGCLGVVKAASLAVDPSPAM